MATGSEILGYQGNPALGVGANPGISVLPDKSSLETINGTVRDLLLTNQQNNLEIFKQKIADRNARQALLYNDQVQAGDIEEGDQKYFDAAKADVEKAYKEWGGDASNTEGFRKYENAVDKLKDTATHAQNRWIGLKTLKGEIANETLPWKRDKMQQWYDQQDKKGFWDHVDPYQQQFDFSVKPILDNLKTVSGVIRDPTDGFFYNQAHADYGGTLQAIQQAVTENGQTAEDMRQLRTRLQAYKPDELIKFINSTNSQIDEYNKQFGTGSGNEVQHLKVDMTSGKPIIQEPTTELMAKYVLASQPQFVSRTPNKEMNDVYSKRMEIAQKGQQIQIAQQRANIEARKVGYDGEKADAYAALATQKLKNIKDSDLKSSTDIQHQMKGYFDNIQPTNFSGKAFGLLKGKTQDVVRLDNLPNSYQYISGPVVNAKGKATIQKIEPYVMNENGQSVPYYLPKYMDAKTGKELQIKDLKDAYGQVKNQFTWNEFLENRREQGVLDLVLKGKNGSANTSSIFSSLKTIAEQGGKKGMENIENPPEDATPSPEDADQSETDHSDNQ